MQNIDVRQSRVYRPQKYLQLKVADILIEPRLYLECDSGPMQIICNQSDTSVGAVFKMRHKIVNDIDGVC